MQLLSSGKGMFEHAVSWSTCISICTDRILGEVTIRRGGRVVKAMDC